MKRRRLHWASAQAEADTHPAQRSSSGCAHDNVFQRVCCGAQDGGGRRQTYFEISRERQDDLFANAMVLQVG